MSRPPTTRFSLPLLAALPAVLAACGDADDLGRYSRARYTSYQECLAANASLAQQGQTPCVRAGTGGVGGGFFYYGPYTRIFGGSTRYVGYTGSGTAASTGLTYDSKKGTYGSFKAPVSRGGFTGGSRSSRGSFGG